MDLTLRATSTPRQFNKRKVGHQHSDRHYYDFTSGLVSCLSCRLLLKVLHMQTVSHAEQDAVAGNCCSAALTGS